MNVALLVAFWATVALLIVVPGPDWAFTLSAGLRDRAVLPAVGGLMLGYCILTAVVAAGVGALVASRPVLLTLLTVVGGAYLAYLGVALLARPGAIHAGDEPGAPPPPARGRLLQGAGVSGLNPKGLLVFLALLPQFTDPGAAWPLWLQLSVLGALFTLSCGAFYAVLGLSARAVLRARPGVSRLLARVSGASMLLIGTFLLVERLGPALLARR